MTPPTNPSTSPPPRVLDSFSVVLEIRPNLPEWLEDATLARVDEMDVRRQIQDYVRDLLARQGVEAVSVKVEGVMD